MNCDEIKKLFPVYIEKKTDKNTDEVVKKHLSECRRCSTEYSMLVSIEDALQSAERVPAPEHLRQVILSEIALEKAMQKERCSMLLILSGMSLVFVTAFLFIIPFGWVFPVLSFLSEKAELYSTFTILTDNIINIGEFISTAFLQEISYKFGLISFFIISSLIYLVIEKLKLHRL